MFVALIAASQKPDIDELQARMRLERERALRDLEEGFANRTRRVEEPDLFFARCVRIADKWWATLVAVLPWRIIPVAAIGTTVAGA